MARKIRKKRKTRTDKGIPKKYPSGNKIPKSIRKAMIRKKRKMK